MSVLPSSPLFSLSLSFIHSFVRSLIRLFCSVCNRERSTSFPVLRLGLEGAVDVLRVGIQSLFSTEALSFPTIEVIKYLATLFGPCLIGEAALYSQPVPLEK